MVIKGMSGIFSGQEFQVKGSLTFGRSPQGCDIHFPDNTKGVSRTHCKVDNTGTGIKLTDMGSSYGTFVNGRKLAPYTPADLNPGDTFWLGDRANSFTVSGTAQGGNGGHGNVQSKSAFNSKILIGIIAAVIVVLAGVLLFINMNKGYDSLDGTWKVTSSPGARMTFADNGDLLYTENGEYVINGEMTYSSAGDHMVSVKYTAPQGVSTIEGGMNAWIFNIGGNRSVYDIYSQGYIWKYKYNKKDNVMDIYDVNGYKLFSLEKSE